MKTKITLLILSLCFAGSSAFAQWSNSGNNYTTGKVGIGINNTTGKKLYVRQTSNDHSALFTSDDGNGVIIHSKVDPLRIGTAGNSSGNLFIINENGTVGIGTGFSFNTSYKLHVAGKGYFSSSLTVGSTGNFSSSLTAYVMYANGFFNNSDRRLKADIKEDFSSFNGIYDIKTYNYELKSETNGKRHFGVMAQEVAEIYPDLVVETENKTLAVNYVELIPQMIRALQEQKQLITALENEVTNLKSELENTTNLNTLNQVSVLYPNPASNSATVQLSNARDLENASVELFDLNGKVIKTQSFDGKASLSIDTSSLNEGVYFIRLMDGLKQIETKRLLIE